MAVGVCARVNACTSGSFGQSAKLNTKSQAMSFGSYVVILNIKQLLVSESYL